MIARRWGKIADVKVGTVTHYFDKIAVAVIKIEKGDLKVEDKVKLTDKEGRQFTQDINSMQIEHASIDIAKAGDEFGLKVERPLKQNSPVVKVK